MMVRKWLTPEVLPSGVIHLCVPMPDLPQWRAVIIGALAPLTYEEKWEQYGAVTPAQAAEFFEGWLSDLLSASECSSEGMVGQVVLWPSEVLPSGWLPCDGRVLQISEYPSLFAVLGNRYGGDGNVDFCLPDMRGRFPRCVNTGVLGETGGAETITIGFGNLPPLQIHTHSLPARVVDPGTQQEVPRQAEPLVIGNSEPLGILPPFITMHYIIKAQ